MKSVLTLLTILLFTQISSAQCVIEPWNLDKRISKSSLVVEGKVIEKKCVWDNQKHNIYTLNTIEVYKTFKGAAVPQVVVATEGGIVGLEALKVSPSLDLQKGDIGIFMMKNHTANFAEVDHIYKPTASVQSYIKYDMETLWALDYNGIYNSIVKELYPEIESQVGEKYKEMKYFNTKKGRTGITPLAPPSITSFSLDTVTAGTGTEITISGSNFGFARGNGKVGFRDANFGDGRYYYPPTGWSYKSWSNSQIKVIVPSRAGTGKIEVTNAGGETGESSNELFIEWSHLNVNYPLNASDTPNFGLSHINENNLGGYTWEMNPKFSRNKDAVASFLRSLEEWRCETKMNWNLGDDTSIDTATRDGTNLVHFTNFDDSKLGVCWSRYSGCFRGDSMQWYVSELDIEFDSTYAWYYGVDNPGFAQYDFQSVTTHELGHGHQLGHVIDNKKVMHYSLTNGQRKANLVPSDITAGNYVSGKSISTGTCSESAMIGVKEGECTITEPTASFASDKSVVCPNEAVLFNDSTRGKVDTYAWTFGDGASSASASSKGPHTITYSTPGEKTIELIAKNSFGTDTFSTTIVVKTNVLDTPSLSVDEDTVCLEEVAYAIAAIEGAESYVWEVSIGGTISENNGETIKINWTQAGSQQVSVYAKNSCVDGAKSEINQFVLADPVAAFSSTEDGIEVTFTNESESAESYLWTFGDGETSTEENPEHKFPDKGTYTTTLKVDNKCGDDESSQELQLAYNVSVVHLENSITFYPNPLKVGESLNVDGVEITSYELHSIDGKLVESDKVQNNTISPSVSTPALYLLTLHATNGTVHYRLQIE